MHLSTILRSNNLKASIIFLILSLICSLILGFLTVNIVRATTTSFDSTSSDGYMIATSIGDPPYNASSGTVYDSQTDMAIGTLGFLPNSYYLYRGYLFFDTSTLPDNANISSAIIKFYGKSEPQGDFNLTVQNGQPTYPHDPLKGSDFYQGYYSGGGGIFDTSSFIEESWNELSLNSTGISWINKTSTTKFCLRSHIDIEQLNYGNAICSFYTFESKAPQLEIVYTVPDYEAYVEAPLHTFFINNTDQTAITNTDWNDVNRILSFETTGNLYVDVGDYGNTINIYIDKEYYTDWSYDETLQRATINNVSSLVELDFSDPEPPETGSSPSGVPLEPEMIEITPTPTTSFKIPVVGLWVIIGGVGIFTVSAFYTKISRPKRRKPRGVRPSKSRRRRVPRKPKRSKRSGRFQ